MRLKPDQRESVILTAAIRVARDSGLMGVNHGSVAKRCSLPTSEKTVRHYFNDRDALWRAVVMACPGEFDAAAGEVGLVPVQRTR